jgi:hypothetical protein
VRNLAYKLGEAGLVILAPAAFILLFVWTCLLAYVGWSVTARLLGDVGRVLAGN